MSQDMLTYRYPRTSIQAFGCDARSACAVYRYKRPMQARVARIIIACSMVSLGVICALAYFDVLVP